MSDQQLFFLKNQVGLGLCIALVVGLAGCVTYVDRPAQGSVYVVPQVQTTFMIEDDYVYYPSYECYYRVNRHQYAYRDGGAWVSRPAPQGVTVNVLLASPSVRMSFHDSPAQHHATVVKQYPRNWAPSGTKQVQKDNRKNDQRDERGNNHGK